MKKIRANETIKKGIVMLMVCVLCWMMCHSHFIW